VAGEVKSLASQTARATEEIKAQVAEIQVMTGSSAKAVYTMGETISRMADAASAIAAAVEEQSAATREIAANVQRAAAGTLEVSVHISGVTGASAKTHAAACQSLDLAGKLAGEAEALQKEIIGFLSEVRQA
jgi:methyl-accepting chemotaxis protein